MHKTPLNSFFFFFKIRYQECSENRLNSSFLYLDLDIKTMFNDTSDAAFTYHLSALLFLLTQLKRNTVATSCNSFRFDMAATLCVNLLPKQGNVE